MLNVLVYKAKLAIDRATALPSEHRSFLRNLLGKYDEFALDEQEAKNCRSIKHLTTVEVWDLIHRETEGIDNAEERYQTITAFISLLEAVRPTSGRYLRRVVEENGFLFGSNWKECVQEMVGMGRNQNQESISTADRIIQHTRTLCLQLQQSESITRAAVLNHLSRECIVPIMPTMACNKRSFEKVIYKLSNHPLYSDVMKTYSQTYCKGIQTQITLYENEDETDSVVVDLSNESTGSTSGELLPLSSTGFKPFIESVYNALLD